MTQTVPWYPRMDPSTGVQQGAVYGYHALRVDRRTGLILDGTIEVGYVGQTIQELAERDAQHRGRKPGPGETVVKCQPFSDVMFGEVFIIEVVPVAQLDEREQHHIERLKPAYNHQLQAKDNPNRIQISEARRHRDARDAAKGIAPRQWPALRNPPPSLRATSAPSRTPAHRPPRLPAKWRRRRNWVLAWAGGVLALWLALALLVAHVHLHVPTLTLLPTSAGAVSMVCTPALPTRRKRRRAWLLIVLVTLILAGVTTR